jgi:DNA invertase Pin-like site-specific DNA recombinase
MLADIDAGKIDLIVVYKVDRLTRSLADFAKLVERFDERGASFVSVTQQFNTATSMGRLTLNVLLSFAQFEREVTAERIRDKIAASKKKGMWMGGHVPLGYDARDRTLVINQKEASTVRTLFDLYLTHGNVRQVKEEAERLGLVSKQRKLANGRISGGVPFTRGRLYHLLTNPVYIGEIRHKKTTYPGQHPAIIDRSTFEAVAHQLRTNSRSRTAPCGSKSSSPLAGKITDETGDRLIPSHSVRRNRRYRYYVSRRFIERSGEANLDGWRLPAPTLESAVANLIGNAFSSATSLQRLTTNVSAEKLKNLLGKANELDGALSSNNRGTLLQNVVKSGRIEPGRMTVTIDRETIAQHLDLRPEDINPAALELVGTFGFRRRGVEARIVLGDSSPGVDKTLLKNVARGWAWFEEIKAGTTMKEIADHEGLSQRRVARLVEMAFLAPDIVQAIVDGRQPATLTSEDLIKSPHKVMWADQRIWLATF